AGHRESPDTTANRNHARACEARARDHASAPARLTQSSRGHEPPDASTRLSTRVDIRIRVTAHARLASRWCSTWIQVVVKTRRLTADARAMGTFGRCVRGLPS